MWSRIVSAFYRYALDYLNTWKKRDNRKPLIIRGARQVGKSFLVNMFADRSFDNLIEINFELMPESASLFSSNNPVEIIPLLEAAFNKRIEPGKTLLFLDEIQAAPEIVTALRYFLEKTPGLHVIAAGSLLDFVLDEHSFSMPVGRIEYLHLGPMLFEEFLLAKGEETFLDWLRQYTVGSEMPEALHNKGMTLIRQFCVCGGLPDSVRAFVADPSGLECASVQQSVLATFKDDFSKYAGRVDTSRIRKVFEGVPGQIGNKFMYSRIDRGERSRDLKKALELLCNARVQYRVYHTHANGIPLKTEIDESVFKVLFLDVGLVSRCLGLGVVDFEKAKDLILINQGAVCEQFVGQELMYAGEWFEEPALFCWIRQKRQSNAEVDYIMNLGETVIPVEVKAGKTGTLKSLHMFLREKKRSSGMRFNSAPASLLRGKTSLSDGKNKEFTLLSLPLYMTGQARRLFRDVIDE